jgi:predicted SnoaL-like aldol condensation-catalyzing enzyme
MQAMTPTTHSDPANLKALAVDFLQKIVAGDIDEAYALHVGPSFRHHNPYFAGDAASLKAGMQQSEAEHSEKIFEIQHVLEDGSFVAVHSRIRQHAQDRGGAVVHLFRFEQNKIVELWDIFHAHPEVMANEHGMF